LRSALILALTDSQALLQGAKKFAASIYDSGAQTDSTGVIESRLWAEFRQSGLAMSPFPKELSGADLCEPGRFNELSAILRLLGSADLSIARIFEGHVNAVSLVARYGDDDQIRALSERVAMGGLSGVWGADDANGLHIVAARKPMLQGKKILASGAGFVTDPLVTAKTDDGQVMCLLHLTMDEPIDLSGWNAQGMRSTATGSIDLTGTAVSSRQHDWRGRGFHAPATLLRRSLAILRSPSWRDGTPRRFVQGPSRGATSRGGSVSAETSGKLHCVGQNSRLLGA
jgi:alkylation response protein AidB-like acyl-CoA dehydrogenase